MKTRPYLICQQCGGGMIKRTLSPPLGLQFIALLVFLCGIAVAITVHVLLGVIVCLLGAAIESRRRKVWRCDVCGSIVERA